MICGILGLGLFSNGSLKFPLLRPYSFLTNLEDKSQTGQHPNVAWHVDHHWNSSPAKTETTRKRILILAGGRTGSSFIGQSFNQHPDIYYSFEPLRLYTPQFLAKNAGNVTGSHLIEQILNCNFSFAFNYVQRKRWICTAFCTSGFPNRTGKLNNCVPSVETLRNACLRAKYVVVKTIRIKNMDVIFDLMRKGIKVIHLFRDPRAQEHSILHTPGFLGVSILHDCKHLDNNLDNMQHFYKNYPAIFMNYCLLRYEDFCQDPLGTVKNLFQFAGIPIHKEVEDWVSDSTKGSSIEPYSLFKTPHQTLQAWRSRLSYNLTAEIQSRCLHSMELLGYMNVSSEHQLRDKHIPFFRNMSVGLPRLGACTANT